jgi:hypothetical protein
LSARAAAKAATTRARNSAQTHHAARALAEFTPERANSARLNRHILKLLQQASAQ